MDCPKCGAEMELVVHAGVEIDRCTSCGGLWFDYREREQLLEAKGSSRIDTGDRSVGAEHNELGKINCPRCSTQMVKMVDVKPPHIWFEQCATCGGSYFDAGEFTDLAAPKLSSFMNFFTRRARS